ncbi:hypothetical protein BN1263320064 [Stenotrophomonas indicatrix]|nr:hypothetical protein BN1263320064 [Stenotrophomonas indicatrix]
MSRKSRCAAKRPSSRHQQRQISAGALPPPSRPHNALNARNKGFPTLESGHAGTAAVCRGDDGIVGLQPRRTDR